MKKLTCFAIIVSLTGLYSSASAQTCSASFSTTLSNKTVTFFPADSSAGITHHWRFGDGSSITTTSAIISHTYSLAGTYLALHSTERPGTTCHDSVVTTIRIPADTCAITATFQYWKDSLNCKKIHFVNTSSPISPNVHFTWSFGDGTGSADVNPAHTYATSGTYLVSLTSQTADSSCRKQVWDTVYVKCGDSCNITARFQYRKDSLNCKKIYFINTSSPISPNVHFAWSFGDGTGSADVNPAHTYATSGTYLVSLVSESGTNCRRQVWDTVYIKCSDSCAYQPLFAWRADSLTTGKVYFTNRTAGAVSGVHYTWFFGDSSAISHDVSPTHSYTHIGTYSVCLVAESGSCRRTYCQLVFVDKMLNGSGFVPAIPNPAISSVTINVTLDRPETVIIRILDGNGITRAEFRKNGLTGNNRFTLPVERLSRGIYLVEIRSGSHKWLSRFQKG